MKKEKTIKNDYIIGLDIGTTSVGYSVVEADNQKVFRKGGKHLWGIRLFEDAQTASGRRGFRSTRRRYDRRRERIRLLQEEFKQEINKVDSNFFIKMKESFYRNDDTKNKTIPISKEERVQIKKHYKKYPTIYHLRKDLIDNPEQQDIRLVYLAIHHIIKNRGNFLYPGNEFDVDNLDIKENLKEVFNSISNLNSEIDISDSDSYLEFDDLENALLEPIKSIRKNKIKESIKGMFPTNFINEFCKMANGNQFDINKLFGIESDTKLTIKFDSTEYDDKYDDYEKQLGDNIEILDSLKQLYDMLFLKRLFKGNKNTSISTLMVDKYNIHKHHLDFLNKIFKNNQNLYHKVLLTNSKESKEVSLYSQYIRNKIDNTEFVKKLQKNLEELFSNNTTINQKLIDEYTKDIKPKIENGEFLPRITDIENGKYPYQLHKSELIKIIENQGEYYSFLKEKLKDGTYKIVKLLEFKIPYYVGPLTDSKNSNFAWMIRNENRKKEKITPYNFDEVINKEDTAEEFIKRMIAKCTYLIDEYVIPNNSILYSKFKVMNELKQIKVNGRKIEQETQKKIYNDLFLKTSGNITDKKFKEYLYSSKSFSMYKEELEVEGYSADKKFANNMQSYIDFFGENGIFANTNYTAEDAEKIIEWITIFEDKYILETKVRREYSKLDDKKVKRILTRKYKGWSNLSKKLLTGIYYKDKETNTNKSIMDLMEETNKNFMQIINDKKYKFQDRINENNQIENVNNISYNLVKDLATSPSTKRGIFQSLKVVRELVNYIGYDPQMIVIEMAREHQNTGRTLDRKKYLTKLYDAAKNDIDNYKKLSDELKNKEAKDLTEKIFLYFLQEGKSLYSGKPLNIANLDQYEVDHIIPRTLIKDDSIENKALVLREENQIKSSSYILPEQYRTSYNKKWWKHLQKNKLISAKKFYNLNRSKYSEDDISGFINRQLVETRQITKYVANIIGSIYKDSKVVYLKASLSHDYRERYDLFKFRDINDYHHAHDAFLAAVLGEYKEKHLKQKIDFEQVKELNNKLRKTKNYKKLNYGYVINSLDTEVEEILVKINTTDFDKETGEVIFDAEKFNKQVEKTLYRNDILISKKVEYRTGEFYNQTKNKKGLAGVPLKKNLPTELYGSYTGLNPSYATLVKYTKKGKEAQRLIGIPIYYIEQNKVENKAIENYLRKLLQLSKEDNLIISERKIPFNTLLDWDGQICYLVGAPVSSGKAEVCNAKEFHFDSRTMKKIKYSLKILFSNSEPEDIKKYEDDLNIIIEYIIKVIDKEYLLYKDLISTLKEMINFNDLSSVSIENKEKIIKELFKLLKCNSETSNFKFLNSKFSSVFGRKNERIISHAKIHNKSVTGIRDITDEF